MRVRYLLPLAVLIMGITSCQMPDNPLNDPDYKPLFTVEDPTEDTPLDETTQLVPPNPPVFDTLPQVYQFASLPVKGRATPNTDIVVRSSALGAVAGRVGNDGTFCVDLPLALNTKQEITARVHNGLFSDYTKTSITQETTEEEEEQDVPKPTIVYENVALNKPIYSDPDPDDGLVSSLNDGNESTYLSFEEDWLGGSSYIWLDLEEVYDIYAIEFIFSTVTEEYPDEIVVFATTNPSIDINEPPSEDNWGEGSQIADYLHIDATGGGKVKQVLDNITKSRFIGFELNHIGNMLTKYNVLSEIKVIVIKQKSQEPPDPNTELTTPTCANGLAI